MVSNILVHLCSFQNLQIIYTTYNILPWQNMKISVSTLQGNKIQNKFLNTSHYKVLLVSSGVCKYQNIVTGYERSPSSEYFNSIQITNNVSKDELTGIEKSTSIRFQEQEIIIQDLYSFDDILFETLRNKTEQIMKYKYKRLHLFKEIGIQSKLHLKKITKNLAKNFLRAFSKFILQSIQRKSSLSQSKLKMLRNKKNYNNSLIEKIIIDPQISPLFEYFLVNEAPQWIQNSKIKDRQAHKDAIEALYEMIYSKKRNFDIQKNVQVEKQTNKKNNDLSSTQGSDQAQNKDQFILNESIQEEQDRSSRKRKRN